MKNIVFVRLQDFPPTSSIDMYYYSKYLGKRSYNIDVITGKSIADISLNNVKIHNNYSSNSFVFFINSIRILNKLHKVKKIDYVYFFSMHPITILIQFYVNVVLGLKTIYDVTSGPIGNNILSKISYYSIKIGIFMSYKFILDSRGLYKILNLSTKKEYEIIGIGFDTELFYEKKIDLFNKNDNEIIFTYIGTLNNERNLNIFLNAFIGNLTKYNNVKLYFIGSGNGELELKRISSKYINENIFFLGKIEHNKINDYINSSDILVSYVPQISYFNYQPPTKLIEYLACNKPVIATNTYAQNEILEGNDLMLHNDDYKSTMDKILYFILNIDKIKNKDYKKLIKDYSWDNLIKKIEKIL